MPRRSCILVPMPWLEPPRETGVELAANRITSAPSSVAEAAQTRPEMPAPMMMTSASYVAAIWSSGTGSGATSKPHEPFLISSALRPPSSAFALAAPKPANAAAPAAPATKDLRFIALCMAPPTENLAARIPSVRAMAGPTLRRRPFAQLTFEWVNSTGSR